MASLRIGPDDAPKAFTGRSAVVACRLPVLLDLALRELASVHGSNVNRELGEAVCAHLARNANELTRPRPSDEFVG